MWETWKPWLVVSGLWLGGGLVLGACGSDLETYRCVEDRDCNTQGVAGFCETTGVCSFLDDTCTGSGRRYGNAAGGLSDTCVATPDAGLEATWFDTRFAQRIPFTITSPVEEELTDFPVLVVMAEPEFDYETIVALSSLRLVFEDQFVPVEYDIADDQRGLQVSFWFKADLPVANTLKYEIYFDRVDDLDAPPEGDIWGGGYAAVWHMNRTGALIGDSTTNANDAVAGIGELTTGRVGNALSANAALAAGSVLGSAPSSSSLEPSGCLSLSAWVRPTTIDTLARGVLEKYGDDDSGPGYRMRYQDRDNGGPSASATPGVMLPATLPVEETTQLAADEWAWLAFTADSEWQFFADGELIGGPVPSPAAIATANGESLKLGLDLDGSLDEVRISGECRSRGWMRGEFLSVKDPLPSFGNSERLVPLD